MVAASVSNPLGPDPAAGLGLSSLSPVGCAGGILVGSCGELEMSQAGDIKVAAC